MKKDHLTELETWCSYDVNGRLMAIFDKQGTGLLQLDEQPVYGLGK